MRYYSLIIFEIAHLTYLITPYLDYNFKYNKLVYNITHEVA